MKIFKELFERLARARVWVALQFGLTLVLILVGAAWTRLPDKHGWQVALTLLTPLLLAICALALQAGTIRKLADDDGRRVKLAWGAMTLLVWIALVCVSWWILDWCDDQIWQWSYYLNSKVSAHGRVGIFTIVHIQTWLTFLEWVLRWIVVPAKVIPYAATSVLWGWRIPLRRVLRILWNWRWWTGVVIAAVLGVYVPGKFFNGEPHGSVSAQIWAVGLKLAGAYLLAVTSWVLALAWWAVLFDRQIKPLAEEALVAVPVPAGPPEGELKAKAEIPPGDAAA